MTSVFCQLQERLPQYVVYQTSLRITVYLIISTSTMMTPFKICSRATMWQRVVTTESQIGKAFARNAFRDVYVGLAEKRSYQQMALATMNM